MDERTERILKFIQRHELAVLSTVDSEGSKPEAAAIEFSETEDLEIIFDTFASYRKYMNIKHNPRGAFVIGWDEEITVQYEGVAQELLGSELDRCQAIHIKKLPKATKFQDLSETRYFKVTPRWIRYSDLGVDPWEVFEIDF